MPRNNVPEYSLVEEGCRYYVRDRWSPMLFLTGEYVV